MTIYSLFGSISKRQFLCIASKSKNPVWIWQRKPLNYCRNSTQAHLENTKVEHSQFLSRAQPNSKWKDENGNGIADHTENELEDLQEGEGKLLPTSSHLFKLILPMDVIARKWREEGTPKREESKPQHSIPTVLLLHPSQPLSHVSRLILASVPPKVRNDMLSITFRSSPTAVSSQRQYQWSDSTDVGDFIRDAASAAEFLICISREKEKELDSDEQTPEDGSETVISVRVPTFADRTRFLRRRLDVINAELSSMEGLKCQCDKEAHRGARRMAVGGFGMLIVYWGAVARLTFWDYGWDVMEPITYLSGLSTVICGYLWFLYRGREVSYSSVLDSSISARREALYKTKGLDIERWVELVNEKKALMKEIGQIKEDYDHPTSRERETKMNEGKEEEELEEEGKPASTS
ncbi:hypothetical protein Moror_10664 [Moniliophthora roreri MCA 2997]|uniref:Calcium uniporter protein, mitochondrial n=1 Tax=Moniliophthora roreri (strain MCA 2997) TaxID=1381753 RepID=V2XGT6_MONRO|nr:hypothetical protein Moror_10664 [Moniliophthora roreri MCA 2997]